MKQDEEVSYDLEWTNFKPAFMSHCKIMESSKKLWKESGEKIQRNQYHIFFLETWNEKNNSLIYGE